MPKTGGRNRAREAIREALPEVGLQNLDAILGEGGTCDFLEGAGWPVAGQVTDIEKALGWPAGTINHIVERSPSDLSGTEQAIATMVHDMDEADRRALLEMLKMTKKHVEASQAALAKEYENLDRKLRVIRGEVAD